MRFDLHIGIDYSGRETPNSRTAALQVYAGMHADEPRRITSPASSDKRFVNWCRKEIADWLLEQAEKDVCFIAGIDHGFSFPLAYLQRYELDSWPRFLEDFCQHWPTAGEHVCVDFVREKCPARVGQNDEFRLTERWTSSAKSVFQFDVQGSVAKSTHAGIPWLWRLRREVGKRLHFWPFDGWEIPQHKCVIAEVYPSIFRNRFPRHDRTVDQQDAYATARWLAEADRNAFLDRYFEPPLTQQERAVATLEGWILGVA